MHLAVTTVLISILAGCAPSFEDRFVEVEAGQTRASVVEALGEPDRAERFSFTSSIMGPPEVLQAVVSEGAEVEELTWTRPVVSDDSVVFQAYLGADDRVVATTGHPIGAVF